MGDLRRTLAIALVGHALALVPFARPAPRVAREPDALLEIDPGVPVENGPAPGLVPETPGRAVPGPAPAPARVVARGDAPAPAGESPARAATADWFSPVQGAPVALLGTAIVPDVPFGPPAPATEENGAVHAVKEALAERDRAGGIVRGGPLVTAAHAAASNEDAPHTGSAFFEVDADPNGVVTSARTEDERWRGVADGILRAMRGKTVRVAPGASGLRTRVRVVAELQRPSGEEKSLKLGAVPDDIPGGEKQCVGKGLERKCLTGMIVGFTVTGADANNLGAAVRRVVHVTILGETDLR